MTKTEKRRLEIIRLLSDLSRDGWRLAKPYDYNALERELATLNAKLK